MKRTLQDSSAGSILSSFYKFKIIQGVLYCKVQRVLLGPNQCHFVLTVHTAPIDILEQYYSYNRLVRFAPYSKHKINQRTQILVVSGCPEERNKLLMSHPSVFNTQQL